ncbi:MAG: nuclear transport factor 2 family protein [Planctomycetota bacterium]|jgi:ketosteroid isomerase-like protein
MPTQLARFGTGSALSLAILLCTASCADKASANLSPAETAAIKSEVDDFLNRYKASMAARDEAAIAQLFVRDERMVWFEDGTLRYRSVIDMLRGLQSIPAGMKIETLYSDRRIQVLSANLATVSAKFDTKVSGEGNQDIGWSGAVTMLLEKDSEGWRVLSGHSSTPSPRGR